MYKGIVIKESLSNSNILDQFQIIKTETTDGSDPWHLYTILADENDFDKLSKEIKENKWYIHFWKDRDVVALFKNKIFRFNFDDKKSWKSVIEYGLSLGIPKEQLDFPID